MIRVSRWCYTFGHPSHTPSFQWDGFYQEATALYEPVLCLKLTMLVLSSLYKDVTLFTFQASIPQLNFWLTLLSASRRSCTNTFMLRLRPLKRILRKILFHNIFIIILASARSFTMQLWETQISQQWHCGDEPFGYSSTGEWVYSTQFIVDHFHFPQFLILNCCFLNNSFRSGGHPSNH